MRTGGATHPRPEKVHSLFRASEQPRSFAALREYFGMAGPTETAHPAGWDFHPIPLRTGLNPTARLRQRHRRHHGPAGRPPAMSVQLEHDVGAARDRAEKTVGDRHRRHAARDQFGEQARPYRHCSCLKLDRQQLHPARVAATACSPRRAAERVEQDTRARRACAAHKSRCAATGKEPPSPST